MLFSLNLNIFNFHKIETTQRPNLPGFDSWMVYLIRFCSLRLKIELLR